MGLFSSSGDTSGSSDYGSKLRTPSYEMDLSSDPAAGFGSGAATSLDLVGGDVQKALQVEQEKANLMAQVWSRSFLNLSTLESRYSFIFSFLIDSQSQRRLLGDLYSFKFIGKFFGWQTRNMLSKLYWTFCRYCSVSYSKICPTWSEDGWKIDYKITFDQSFSDRYDATFYMHSDLRKINRV